MAEIKFTPGPWDIKENLGTDEAYCDWHKVGPVDLMGGKANANSHLIAAAPELYEALYRLVRDCEIASLQEQAGFDCWINMANNALAKARGEAV